MGEVWRVCDSERIIGSSRGVEFDSGHVVSVCVCVRAPLYETHLMLFHTCSQMLRSRLETGSWGTDKTDALVQQQQQTEWRSSSGWFTLFLLHIKICEDNQIRLDQTDPVVRLRAQTLSYSSHCVCCQIETQWAEQPPVSRSDMSHTVTDDEDDTPLTRTDWYQNKKNKNIKNNHREVLHLTFHHWIRFNWYTWINNRHEV